jgi:hypothetical protein
LVMHLHLVWTLLTFAAAVVAQKCSGDYDQCPDRLCCSQWGWW